MDKPSIPSNNIFDRNALDDSIESKPSNSLSGRPGIPTIPKPRATNHSPIQNKENKLKNPGSIIEVSFFVLGFLTLASLLFGIISFNNPLYTNSTQGAQYVNSGIYSYSGSAPAGIYNSSSINTGDPIFPKFTCQVFLQFDYLLMGDQLSNISGSHQLVANVVEETSGWHRTISLEAATSFTGNSFSALASFNICDIQTLIEGFEQQTDLHPYTYALIITPNVNISGLATGLSLSEIFNPPLAFQLDKSHAYILKSDNNPDPFHPFQEGIIKNPQLVANTIHFLGMNLSVLTLRVFSIFGILLSLVCLVFLGVYISQVAHRRQESYMRIKYSSMLVDIQNLELKAGTPIVDVDSMEDLVKLAARSNSVILHQSQGLMHNYLVQGDQMIYRYSLSSLESEDA